MAYEPDTWSRCENTTITSVIGNNGTNVNGTTDTGKWGNGLRFDANGEYAHFTPVSLNLNEYILALWLNTDYAVTNGVPQDSSDHVIGGMASSSGSTLESSIWLHTSSKFCLQHHTGGFILTGAEPSWSAGDWVHIVLVVSRSASFDGSKTVAIYADGVQEGSTTTALDDWSGQSNLRLTIGNYSAFSAASTKPVDGVIDNVKLYAGVGDLQAVLDERRDERGNLHDQIC